MELLIFVALVVIFIFIINIQSSLRSNADELKKDVSKLNNQLQELKFQVSNLQFNTPKATPAQQTEQQQKEKEAAELEAQEEYKRKLAAIEALRLQREAKKKEEEEKQLQQHPVVTVAVNETIDAPKVKAPQAPPPPKESWSEKWIRNNPDLEKFIGENLVSKIGIGVLVLAIGFFVKYAIDQNWIGEVGRVAIGILCGGILIALAHKLRNSYRNFSSILAGGGLAVFYFTITLAFQQFQLFSQTKAFVIMAVITIFAVVLSLLIISKS